jgi:hypothetical protein
MGQKETGSQPKVGQPKIVAAPPTQVEQVTAVVELATPGGPAQSIAPADLPTESNACRLRQANLLQLQRNQGNQYVQRFVAETCQVLKYVYSKLADR